MSISTSYESESMIFKYVSLTRAKNTLVESLSRRLTVLNEALCRLRDEQDQDHELLKSQESQLQEATENLLRVSEGLQQADIGRSIGDAAPAVGSAVEHRPEQRQTGPLAG